MTQNSLSFLLLLIAFLAPLQTVALAVGFLVAVDLATGIWASAKTGGRITSNRLGRSVTKSLVYMTAIVVAHVAETYVFGSAAPLVRVVSGFIGSTELLSIYENLSRISGMDFRKLIQEKLLPSARPEKEHR